MSKILYLLTRRANILFPEIAIPGRNAVTIINFCQNDDFENVTLRLVRCMNLTDSIGSDHQTEILSQNTSLITGNGAIQLAIPRQKIGIYDLQVLFNCNLSDSNCTLEASSHVKLIGDIRDVLIRPTSNYYRPGETISFHVMAIDYALQTPGSVTGNIYVKDPSNRKVGLWADVPLNEPNKKHEIPLSDRAPLGKWMIEVDLEYVKFSCELNISLERGSTEISRHEQTVAERHFVELQFSEEMKTWYKPGLPLIGKVNAVSSEEEVRVRVKVIDEQMIVLYSQDIDMIGREGSFLVPAVLTNTTEIAVQAELISLGGKDVDSQYILARRMLNRWNSTSQCFIMIQEPKSSYLPNMDTEITIISSCQCIKNDVHHIVITEGRITSSNNFKFQNYTPIEVDNIMQGVRICKFNISFNVEAEMAPKSHLLVYYNADNGEIVSDEFIFDVRLQQEQVTIVIDEGNEWGLDEPIKFGLIAQENSQICLIGGRTVAKRIASKKSIQYLIGDGITFMNKSVEHNGEDLHLAHESFFPQHLVDQLWMWKCFTYTKDIEANGVTLPSPEVNGKSLLWALLISKETGLSISKPVTINVFSPLTVSFDLPKNMKIMEILQVEINIMNNVNSCIDVHAVVSLSDGIMYPGIDSPVVSEKLRLGGNGATSVVVRIKPTSVGRKTISTFVTYFVREGCQEVTYMFEDLDDQSPFTNKIIRSDSFEAISDGVRKIQTQDAFFCANEYVLPLAEDDVNFSFVRVPRKRYGVVLEIQAEKGVHIALSEFENSTEEMYQITLGDYENTVSWIGRGMRDDEVHLISAQTPKLLSNSEKRTFWISWDHNIVSVGRDNEIGVDKIMEHSITNELKVNFIGFSTNWGVDATIVIWAYNEASGYSQVIQMDMPKLILAGTEKGSLLIASGINLNTDFFPNAKFYSEFRFSSLQSVISSFAPILMLDRSSEAQEKNPEFFQTLQQNLQVLFNYMNPDYSFSNHPSLRDYRATLCVLEMLRTMQFYIEIDPDLISNVNNWILKHQMDDGHFQDDANISKTDQILLTAETLVTLLGVSYGEGTNEPLIKGKLFLEQNFHLINKSCYTMAVTNYALALSRSRLFKSDGNQVHPTGLNTNNEFEIPPQSASFTPFEWLYEDDGGTSENKKKELATAHLKEFKSALYILMLHCFTNNLEKAKPIAQYIFSHSQIVSQHPELLYATAKAIVEFALLEPAPHSSLTISLATSGMELTDTIELLGKNSTSLIVPSLPTKVFIYVTGAGCSSVQGIVTYSTYTTNRPEKFNLSSAIEERIPAHYNSINDPEGTFPTLKLKTCFISKKVTRAVLLEVDLFTGYNLVSVLSEYKNLTYGSFNYKVWFTFTDVPVNCTTCVTYLVESRFTVTSLRPMYAKVYDMDEPQIMDEIFFHDNSEKSILLADLNDDHFFKWFGVRIGKLPPKIDGIECQSKYTSMKSALKIPVTTTKINFKIPEEDNFTTSSSATSIEITKENLPENSSTLTTEKDPISNFNSNTTESPFNLLENSSTLTTEKDPISNFTTESPFRILEQSTIQKVTTLNKSQILVPTLLTPLTTVVYLDTIPTTVPIIDSTQNSNSTFLNSTTTDYVSTVTIDVVVDKMKVSTEAPVNETKNLLQIGTIGSTTPSLIFTTKFSESESTATTESDVYLNEIDSDESSSSEKIDKFSKQINKKFSKPTENVFKNISVPLKILKNISESVVASSQNLMMTPIISHIISTTPPNLKKIFIEKNNTSSGWNDTKILKGSDEVQNKMELEKGKRILGNEYGNDEFSKNIADTVTDVKIKNLKKNINQDKKILNPLKRNKHSKTVNKIVVGQNELVFDFNNSAETVSVPGTESVTETKHTSKKEYEEKSYLRILKDTEKDKNR